MGRERLRRIAGIVGLACYWPYLRRFEFEQFFNGYAMPSAMWFSYTVITWLNVALLMLCVARHARVEGLARRPAVGLAAGLAASLGYGAIVAAPGLGDSFELAGMLIGSALLGTGFCGLTVAWMCWLSYDAGGRALKDALLSFALCCLLSFSSLLPPVPVMVVAVVMPLASGCLWACSDRGSGDRGKRVDLSAFGGEKPRVSLLVSVILLFLIGRITAGLLHFDEGAIQVIERTSSAVVSCLILGAIYLTAARAGRLTTMVRQAWLVLVVVFLAGETVVVLFDGVVQQVGTAVFWASLGCFEVLILAVVAMWCSAAGMSPVVVLGLATVLLRVVPSWVGKFVVPAAMDALGIVPATTVAGFVLASSVLLVSSTLLFLNAMVESGAGVGVVAGSQGQGDAVLQLAETYLLTPRESDVLGLLLQGLSYQAIADRLEVTLGTVQTHTKGIYRKLDVHSRDELVERAQKI